MMELWIRLYLYAHLGVCLLRTRVVGSLLWGRARCVEYFEVDALRVAVFLCLVRVAWLNCGALVVGVGEPVLFFSFLEEVGVEEAAFRIDEYEGIFAFLF